MTDRARAAATLGVLALLLVLGVRWGLTQVTEPFPETVSAPSICTPTLVTAGQTLRPEDITVSVLNASTVGGLAGSTMEKLVDAGFGRGEIGDAPDAGVRTVQVYAADRRRSDVALLRSYLGPRLDVVDTESTRPGLVIVVGQKFAGVRSGRGIITARDDLTVCRPLPE
ncbi:LytR C-terminal domain-containing protein [Nocardioides sp.]|uniref:LytR C-terminal domain-containing protein n=1 Tax=Nocardioides sp. TaxID=35761 RepID=UPI0035176D46